MYHRILSARSHSRAHCAYREVFSAPCVFDGINGQCFRAYVEQQLVATLKPGDIVIMDNLGSHKSAAFRPILKAAGARLWYLPPYLADLNPIEQAVAKIKHGMRAAQKCTVEDTWRHIGSLLETIPPAKYDNYFANAGYASVKMRNALIAAAMDILEADEIAT